VENAEQELKEMPELKKLMKLIVLVTFLNLIGVSFYLLNFTGLAPYYYMKQLGFCLASLHGTSVPVIYDYIAKCNFIAVKIQPGHKVKMLLDKVLNKGPANNPTATITQLIGV
jgi:hypothetical protein